MYIKYFPYSILRLPYAVHVDIVPYLVTNRLWCRYMKGSKRCNLHKWDAKRRMAIFANVYAESEDKDKKGQ